MATETSNKPSISTDMFLEGAAYRRSVYALKDSSAVSDERVRDIIQKIQSFAPSSYNTQPVRITLVTGEKHKQFWDIIIKETEPILKSFGAWDAMFPSFQAFRAAYGSILFWESGATIKESQETHKSAAHMFPQFGDHTSGMFQILMWSALELEGLGANLQHVNAFGPGLEGALKKFLDVPEDYSLKANLNYGDEAQPHSDAPAKLPFNDVFSYVH